MDATYEKLSDPASLRVFIRVEFFCPCGQKVRIWLNTKYNCRCGEVYTIDYNLFRLTREITEEHR